MCLAVLLAAGPAAAQTSPPAEPGAPVAPTSTVPMTETPAERGAFAPQPPKEDPTAHRHDGFYLRLGLGAGYGRATSSGTLYGQSVKMTYKGWGPAYELLIGGTVATGFVVGGGFVGQDIKDPTLSLEMNGTSLDALLGSQDLTVHGSLGVGALGPFVDWFPDERGGLHVGAMLGLALLGLPGDQGFAGSLWGGYDVWVGNQWSLGAQARAAAVRANRTLEGFDGRLSDTAVTYELLFTALYH
jgi:hypothetical protein